MNHILAQAAVLAQASASEQASSGGIHPVILIVVMALLFWVLLIRPQRKAQKEQQERQNSLRKGDKVITSAGIHGSVIYVDTNTVTVQVAEGVNMKFEKSAIVHVIKKDAELKQDDKK
ncbi:preprotein translocase subunit YajC [Akkermansia sp. N21169]|jgi:preprotein translocase subunit YajC|uniref:preprotein translocase subunit YajC n=1 Tax=unclassified Akkermansia TaxID=2608915 RepID=UPI00244E7F5B|nr:MULTISPECIES: preprotein translocase subunit YajC [unclassified Akkermansia]MDH3067863.1 preprotein translocase subunit YajC [Akkermansia sp. N21169]WPX41694.1 preprotein translocase subunit YajC [Akkermansia sp. N21116]